MRLALKGQQTVIGALKTYKEWKIKMGYTKKEDNFEKHKIEFEKVNYGAASVISTVSGNKK